MRTLNIILIQMHTTCSGIIFQPCSRDPQSVVEELLITGLMKLFHLRQDLDMNRNLRNFYFTHAF